MLFLLQLVWGRSLLGPRSFWILSGIFVGLVHGGVRSCFLGQAIEDGALAVERHGKG